MTAEFKTSRKICVFLVLARKFKWDTVFQPIGLYLHHWKYAFLCCRKMGSLGENKAPKFVRKPQLRQEDDGNRLIFECELSGHPQPDVSWFRSDEKIVEDGRTVFKTTETQVGTYMVVLELDDVIESDAGLYKIRAKNTHGDVAASINLNFSRKSCLTCLEESLLWILFPHFLKSFEIK